MRALIKADLRPIRIFNNKRDSRDEYDEAVIQIFRDLGYKIRLRGQEELIDSEAVYEIFRDVPDEIRNEEQNHLIALCYTSEGQVPFVICSVNPTEIHIRMRYQYFGQIRKSCADIWLKAQTLRRVRLSGLYLHERVGLFSRVDDGLDLESEKISPYLKVRKVIEVMEPKSFFPTIKGEIVQNPLREVITKDYAEVIVMIISVLLAVILFLRTPAMSPSIKVYMEYFGFAFETSYIQGALERIFSAFVVTFFISFVGIVVKYFVLRRKRPIEWSPIEEGRKGP